MDPKEIKSAVKEAIQEPLEKFKEEITNSVDEKVKAIEERVSKIESLPLNKLSFGIKTTSERYKGYKLSEQMREIRNRAVKQRERFPVFSDDQKAEEYIKWMIDVVKILTKKDFEGIAALKEFYQQKGYSSGVGSEGGYLIPEEYLKEIVELARDESFALRLCTTINMGSNTVKLPKEASLVTVSWVDESASITESSGSFGQVQLTAKKLAGLATLPNELLEDSAIDLVGLLTEQFAYAVGLELDNQVLNGNGSPFTGVLSGAGKSVQMETGKTSFSDITADHLRKMIKQLSAKYRGKATFIYNGDIQFYIDTLKDSNGRYIYREPSDPAAPGKVWSRPIFESVKAPGDAQDAANTPFVALGDFKYYYVGRRVGIGSLAVDPYGKFDSDQTRFRIVTRWGLAIAMADAFCRLLTAAS